MAKKIKTNNDGWVQFENRQRGYKGDTGSWARVVKEENATVLKIKRAQSGIVSSGYEQELREFGLEYGIDFESLRPGQTAKAILA